MLLIMAGYCWKNPKDKSPPWRSCLDGPGVVYWDCWSNWPTLAVALGPATRGAFYVRRLMPVPLCALV
jgi:hypothetical protein